MTFRHPDVEQHYLRVMAMKVGGLADEERPIFALNGCLRFRLKYGDQSAELQEITNRLLSPELRPALRSWYGRYEIADANIQFNEIRKTLSELAGEKFAAASPKDLR